MPTVTAAILVIGNEILSGRTQDANLAFLARRLTGIGVRLREARVVPDDADEIVAALDALRSRYDHVFTTGGIGPTHDDITSACVARAFGVPLERNPEAVRRLEAHYGDPAMLNAARLRMAEIPAGATLIDNPVSAAPGFTIGNVHVLAGVPTIMQAMFDGIAAGLKGGDPVHARTVTCSLAEGTLAEGLGALQDRYPGLEIGSYPWFRNRQFGVSLVLRGTDVAELDRATEELCGLVRSLGGEPEVGGGDA
ncbi:competence/damage-inducible protein A [Arenibaculum sp.]|jgi:molybdenum cofactor synthesis domain-containing protein|uniref:competence/damage-inducible protein A n=1 Tax=Arenibaculum sp. TaxID=2865862 RepID=UPI002E14C53B|nr:competence/damage-inducible protein A [Arenibaculum sp.]